MKRYSQHRLPALITEVQTAPLMNLLLVLLLSVLILVPVLRGVSLGHDEKEPEEVPEITLELHVSADLTLKLDGREVAQLELIPELKKRVSAKAGLGVCVRAPSTLTTPALLQIMDALHTAGVQHTAVTTEPVKKQ